MSLRFIEVFDEYRNKPHGHGNYDCNLMVLEATGFDISTIAPYTTAFGGLKALRATGYKRMSEYLIDIGYTQINSIFISDFDIVVKGASCGIYFNGHLFALDENKCFNFLKVDKTYFKDKEVFQWV